MKPPLYAIDRWASGSLTRSPKDPFVVSWPKQFGEQTCVYTYHSYLFVRELRAEKKDHYNAFNFKCSIFRVEYQVKSRTIEQQIQTLRSELEVLKVEDGMMLVNQPPIPSHHPDLPMPQYNEVSERKRGEKSFCCLKVRNIPELVI